MCVREIERMCVFVSVCVYVCLTGFNVACERARLSRTVFSEADRKLCLIHLATPNESHLASLLLLSVSLHTPSFSLLLCLYPPQISFHTCLFLSLSFSLSLPLIHLSMASFSSFPLFISLFLFSLLLSMGVQASILNKTTHQIYFGHQNVTD